MAGERLFGRHRPDVACAQRKRVEALVMMVAAQPSIRRGASQVFVVAEIHPATARFLITTMTMTQFITAVLPVLLGVVIEENEYRRVFESTLRS